MCYVNYLGTRSENQQGDVYSYYIHIGGPSYCDHHITVRSTVLVKYYTDMSIHNRFECSLAQLHTMTQLTTTYLLNHCPISFTMHKSTCLNSDKGMRVKPW